jgi:hypothetical protein
MTNIKLQLKAKQAFDFLNDHPALNNPSSSVCVFGSSIWFYMARCCKHNLSDGCLYDVNVYRGTKGWEKYKDKFDKTFEKDKDTPKLLQSIRVPYKEYYGEPWKFDHVEYWYETTFYAFLGNPYNRKEDYASENWGGYCGPEGGANTFDEMLIKCAAAVKRKFGNFNSYYDMHTKEELANHKKNMPMLFKPIKGDKRGCKLMVDNPKYKNVSQGEINLRWLKWYNQTDSCKKNWPGQFDKLIAKLK